MRIGVPPSSVNCFEGDAFCLPFAPADTGAMRVPRPAAGIMTITFIAGCKYTSGDQGVQMLRGLLSPTVDERTASIKRSEGFVSASSAHSAVKSFRGHNGVL